ncbi:MAG: Lacal_2735 family protein [Cyclobacteriaceae bacterium]
MNFFTKKTPKQILEEKYRKLLQESFKLSKTDRQASDLKAKEADEVAKKNRSLISWLVKK